MTVSELAAVIPEGIAIELHSEWSAVRYDRQNPTDVSELGGLAVALVIPFQDDRGAREILAVRVRA